MKRHRPIPSTGIAVPVTNTRPVLRSSTRFNQIVPTTPAALSYKDLIRVVGVDPESNPLYWRKAIDHSAETVVFFQVDLRGTLPRMCKSVRICQEAGDRQRLIPRVYIGETLLSGDYVKTIIGRRYLADEDDLMKLLEHAGVLKENQEPVVEEQDEENADGDSYSEEREDDAGSPEPVPKRVRFGEKLQAPRTTRIISHDRRPTSHRTVTLATPDHRNTDLGNTGGRHTRDLAPLFPMDNSVKAPIETGVPEDVPDETDFEMSVLPVDDAADYEDDLPLGDDVPGPSASLENADGPTGKMPPIRHSQPHPAVEDNPANNSDGQIRMARLISSRMPDALGFCSDEISVLLDQVQANPLLWRTTGEMKAGPTGVQGAQARQRGWQQVAAVVSTARLDGAPVKTGDECYKKWRNLMRTFGRIVKHQNDDGQLTTKWQWTAKMLFVLPVVRSRTGERLVLQAAPD
ncbi:uncharacterized protein LOC129585482 [Paramacrobiotus metropolitanus]|uniref:uncharacterized protein LOC129585482 n=1 Tax=Paramacrobiotus metropolitanus TaxID=2943436 RepID=UPI002445E6FE|nr:uncharacterized protein LOC129585482 [Paramacrobiotus metropolitanus]